MKWIDDVPDWLHKAGIRRGDFLYLSLAQLESQTRPGPGHTLKSQLWALGMLHGPKNHGERAMIWRKNAAGKLECCPMTPGDMAKELMKRAVAYFAPAELSEADHKLLLSDLRKQYSKEHIRRTLADLEADGVAERRRSDGRPLKTLSADARRQLSNGQVHTYFWARPKDPNPQRIKDEWGELKASILPPAPLSDGPTDTDISTGDVEVPMKWLPSVCIPQIFRILRIDLYELFYSSSPLDSNCKERISLSQASAKLRAALAKPQYHETLHAALKSVHNILVEKAKQVLAATEAGSEVASERPPDVAPPRPSEVAIKLRQVVMGGVIGGVNGGPSSAVAPSLIKETNPTTTTVAEPTLSEDADVVVAELRKHGTTTLKAAGKLVADCRKLFREATAAEMVGVIQEAADGMRSGVTNPIGLLLTTVPEHFRDYNRAARAEAVQAAGRQRSPQAPFSVDDLRAHLEACAEAVPYPEVAEPLRLLAAESGSRYADLEKLEGDLSALEEQMLVLTLAGQTAEQRAATRRELNRQLRPYHGKMTSNQLATLEKQYIERNILEQAKLPRLSLFYIGTQAKGTAS